MQTTTETRQTRSGWIWGGLWLLAASGGLLGLAIVHTSPGDRGVGPGYWPASAPWTHVQGSQSLMMFAHPRCPCTRAAIRELAIIRARLDERCTVRVVFYQPQGASADWQTTDIVAQARALSGVDVCWDEGGRTAELFGARTSGHVLFYDKVGQLRFSGGITAARGHDGDNPGRAALLALGAQGRAVIGRTPVFGCSLTQPGDPSPCYVTDNAP